MSAGLTGLSTGAAIGSAVPGLGTAAGAAIGAIVGFSGAMISAQTTLEDLSRSMSKIVSDNKSDIDSAKKLLALQTQLTSESDPYKIMELKDAIEETSSGIKNSAFADKILRSASNVDDFNKAVSDFSKSAKPIEVLERLPALIAQMSKELKISEQGGNMGAITSAFSTFGNFSSKSFKNIIEGDRLPFLSAYAQMEKEADRNGRKIQRLVEKTFADVSGIFLDLGDSIVKDKPELLNDYNDLIKNFSIYKDQGNLEVKLQPFVDQNLITQDLADKLVLIAEDLTNDVFQGYLKNLSNGLQRQKTIRTKTKENSNGLIQDTESQKNVFSKINIGLSKSLFETATNLENIDFKSSLDKLNFEKLGEIFDTSFSSIGKNLEESAKSQFELLSSRFKYARENSALLERDVSFGETTQAKQKEFSLQRSQRVSAFLDTNIKPGQTNRTAAEAFVKQSELIYNTNIENIKNLGLKQDETSKLALVKFVEEEKQNKIKFDNAQKNSAALFNAEQTYAQKILKFKQKIAEADFKLNQRKLDNALKEKQVTESFNFANQMIQAKTQADISMMGIGAEVNPNFYVGKSKFQQEDIRFKQEREKAEMELAAGIRTASNENQLGEFQLRLLADNNAATSENSIVTKELTTAILNIPPGVSTTKSGASGVQSDEEYAAAYTNNPLKNFINNRQSAFINQMAGPVLQQESLGTQSASKPEVSRVQSDEEYAAQFDSLLNYIDKRGVELQKSQLQKTQIFDSDFEKQILEQFRFYDYASIPREKESKASFTYDQAMVNPAQNEPPPIYEQFFNTYTGNAQKNQLPVEQRLNQQVLKDNQLYKDRQEGRYVENGSYIVESYKRQQKYPARPNPPNPDSAYADSYGQSADEAVRQDHIKYPRPGPINSKYAYGGKQNLGGYKSYDSLDFTNPPILGPSLSPLRRNNTSTQPPSENQSSFNDFVNERVKQTTSPVNRIDPDTSKLKTSAQELIQFKQTELNLLKEQETIATRLGQLNTINISQGGLTTAETKEQVALTTQKELIDRNVRKAAQDRYAFETKITAENKRQVDYAKYLASRGKFTTGVQKAMDTIKDETEMFKETLGTTTVNSFRDGLVGAMDAALNKADDLESALKGVAAGFLREIQGVMLRNIANNVVSSMGSAFSFGQTQGEQRGGLIRAQSGMYISGGRTGDKNPAMLEDGEYVLNRNAVQAMGGPSAIDQLNFNAFPRFGGKRKGGKIGHFAVGGDPGSMSASVNLARPFEDLSGFGREQSPEFQVYMDEIREAQAKKDKKKAENKALLNQFIGTVIGTGLSMGISYGLDKMSQSFQANANLKGATGALSDGTTTAVSSFSDAKSLINSGGSVTLANGSSFTKADFGKIDFNRSSFNEMAASRFAGSGMTVKSGGPFSKSNYNVRGTTTPYESLFPEYGTKVNANFNTPSAAYGFSRNISNFKPQIPNVRGRRQEGGAIGFNQGGFLPYGSRLTDSIPAYLSGGEYVVNSRSVRKYGVGGLNRINSGVARFAEGGMVGDNQSESNNTSNSTANNVSINITVNANGNGDNKEEKDTKGEGTQGPANELSAKIKSVVLEVISTEQRTGGLLDSTKKR
jgi:hypothetical protein